MPPPPISELILRHLVPVLELPWPLDTGALFARRAPLVVEIGFGNGAFLAEQAARHPERDHLGVELSWACVDRLFRRLENGRLTNVKVIREDAAFAVARLLQHASVTAFVINHPDPWPKERHHPRRLIQPELIEALADKLVPGGRVTIATDHPDYARWIARVLESQQRLASIFPETERPTLPGHLPTKYELKARAQGIENHFFVWEKRPEAPLPPLETESPAAMPNVILEGTPASDLFADFETVSSSERHDGIDVTLKLARVWQRPGGQGWLIETLVREGALAQEIGLLVLPQDGRCMVKVAALGHPRATWGVKRAVGLLANLLVARQPDLRIVGSTVADV